MKIGSPRTNKFKIGTAEVRVGPLSLAGQLTQAHSIGLLDNVTVEVTQESLDLEGGFPKVPVDTAIVKQSAAVNATLREYSRRNLRLMMGAGVEATGPVGVSSLLTADETSGAVALDVTAGTGTNFVVGSLVVIYSLLAPEKVSVCLVTAVAANIVTLSADTPTLFDYSGTTNDAVIFTANPVSIGNITNANYVSVQVLQQERATGRPIGYNFWKAAISSGLSDGSNADDFASTELGLKILVPAASEYAVSGVMDHLAAVIPDYPLGMYFGGAD